MTRDLGLLLSTRTSSFQCFGGLEFRGFVVVFQTDGIFTQILFKLLCLIQYNPLVKTHCDASGTVIINHNRHED